MSRIRLRHWYDWHRRCAGMELRRLRLSRGFLSELRFLATSRRGGTAGHRTGLRIARTFGAPAPGCVSGVRSARQWTDLRPKDHRNGCSPVASRLELVYLAPKKLADQLGGVGWTSTGVGTDEAREAGNALSSRIESGETFGKSLAVFIESVGDFVNTPADDAMQELIKLAIAAGHFIVADGDPAVLGGFSALLQILKASRYGFALQPEQMDGSGVFKTAFPRVSQAQFPPVRALRLRWTDVGSSTRIATMMTVESNGHSVTEPQRRTVEVTAIDREGHNVAERG